MSFPVPTAPSDSTTALSLAVRRKTGPGRRRRSRRSADGSTRVIGFASLVPVLAVISAVPVLNLLSLGYLLEASEESPDPVASATDGSVWPVSRPSARSWRPFGSPRSRAPRPQLLEDAELIAPGSANAVALRALLVALILLLSLHLGWAIVRGGKFRHFLWPAPWSFLRSLGSRDATIRSWISKGMTGFRNLRLAYFFRLGALGFAGAALWLAGPVLILMVAAGFENPGVSFLGSLLGALLLGLVVLYLPLLQTRFARSGRFGSFSIQGRHALPSGRLPWLFGSDSPAPCSSPCPSIC